MNTRRFAQEVLAEPFPEAVAQGIVLVFAREMNELSLGQNQLPTQIRVSRCFWGEIVSRDDSPGG